MSIDTCRNFVKFDLEADRMVICARAGKLAAGFFVRLSCPATSAITTGYAKPIPTSPLTSRAIGKTPVIAEGRRCRAGRVAGISKGQGPKATKWPRHQQK